MPDKAGLEAIARRKGYGGYQRHIFLCAGQGPCTNGASVEHLWQLLKQRLAELEPNPTAPMVGRSKTECLRICADGPTALVYPEGTLYFGLDEAKLERVIAEHLIGGRVVEEYAIMSAPLKAPSA
jgi:(2Fe-2S) ferredoxin